VIAILNKGLNDSIFDSATLAKRLEPFGMTLPAKPNSPEAFRDFIAQQTAYQSKLAKLTGSLNPSR
jgi:hypothetical protein